VSFEIAVIGGLLGASFLFVYISSLLDKEKYGVLQVLFMFLSLITATVSISVASAFLRIEATKQSITEYGTLADTLDIIFMVMVYAFGFVLLVFMLALILAAFGVWKHKRENYEAG
jgi:hypothetical protein